MKLLILLAAALATASAAKADCRSELEAIMQAHVKAGPYHTSVDMMMNGKHHKIDSDVILPNAVHMVVTGAEIIMIKDDTWVKKNGHWLKLPAAAAGAIGAKMEDALARGLKGASNFTCGGNGDFEAKSYPVYGFDSSSDVNGIAAKSHITLFRGENGLPVGMKMEGSAMGKPLNTTQKITYDPSITIAPPH